MLLVLTSMMSLKGDFTCYYIAFYLHNFVHVYFRNKLASDIVDTLFTLSFTGDGYLHTDLLLSDPATLLYISIKPFSTEGLVMFAYDEQVSNNIILLSVIYCVSMAGQCFFRSIL